MGANSIEMMEDLQELLLRNAKQKFYGLAEDGIIELRSNANGNGNNGNGCELFHVTVIVETCYHLMSLKLMKNSRFRHCEQSEAIQTKHSNSLDCFVPRNDVERYLFASFSDIMLSLGSRKFEWRNVS